MWGAGAEAEVEYYLSEGVAVLSLNRGQSNALSPAMRAEVSACLARAAQDPDVVAVVLSGRGGVFCSGVDLLEYDDRLAQPWIDTLTRMIEQSEKPVVAALQGAALGAGFELALAAHARVAQKDCALALPEVKIGLMPSGGSTQRLPRLLGAQTALELMLSGRSVRAGEPKLARLFAQLTQGDPLDAAVAEARRLAQTPQDRTTDAIERGFSDPMAYHNTIRELSDRLGASPGAEGDILRCVEAAHLLPYEQGLNFEKSAFEDLMERVDSRAARHVYTAERRSSVWPETAKGRARPVETVVLLGQDAVLAELAVFCLDRGQRVMLIARGEAGAAMMARAKAIYDGAVARQRMTPEARDARLARFELVSDAAVLKTADLVFDSGAGEVAPGSTKPGMVWCTVAEQDVTLRQKELGAEIDLLGVRVYRPAHSVPLVEVAVPEGAQADAVVTVAQYFSGNGRNVLRSTAQPGMIGYRIIGAMQCAALALLRAGARAADIEAAARTLGFAVGPLRMIELDGLGAVLARLRRVIGETAALTVLEARAEEVIFGETRGQGFYADHDQALVLDPTLNHWVEDWRMEQAGLPDMPDVPLARALHSAVVAEAGRMLAQGVVSRASDIDLCVVKGYKFDRSLGGPLLLADIEGLLGLVRTMKELEPVCEAVWQTPDNLQDMVKYGQRFFQPQT